MQKQILPKMIVLSALALSLAFAPTRRAWSDSESRPVDAESGGAGQTVTIYRDTFGVPHIYADTLGALYFGFGYAMAEDRLFQIEYLRRAASGRMAEIYGPKALASDKAARRILDSDELYRAILEAQDAETRITIQAYVDGVNQYIKEAKENPAKKMPKEFAAFGIELTPFTVLDSLKISTLMSREFGFKGGRELENLAFLRELAARYGEDEAGKIFDDILPQNDPDAYTSIPAASRRSEVSPVAAPPGHKEITTVGRLDISSVAAGRNAEREELRKTLKDFVKPASCAWAVAPKKSASGNTLMGVCTADGAEARLHGAGIDAFGYAFPGVPSLAGAGRTKNIVWQFTVGYSDQIDTYIETLHPENKHRYRYKGEWREMERRTEIIAVRGENPVEFEVCRTVHGPVVGWDLEHDRAYSIKFAGSDLKPEESLESPAMLAMFRARNYEQFEKAVRSLILNVNVVYGDNEGNIAYWYAGRHPVRPENVDSRLPVPGTGEFEWLGYIPADELPHCKNPEQGYLVSWNNKPVNGWEDGDLGRWGKTHRVYKPVELIEPDPSVTWEDNLRFHELISKSWGHVGTNIDQNTTTPDFFKRHIARAAAMSDDPAVKRAASYIERWNGLYEDLSGDGHYDSVGLTIYRKWLPIAIKNVFADDIGEGRVVVPYCYSPSLLLRALQGEDAGLPLSRDYFNGRDTDVVINESMMEALEELAAEYGTADMTKWKHPVFKKNFKETMPGLATALGFIEEIPENGAAGYTHFAELSKPSMRMVSVIPTGGQRWFISLDGKPSPHLADQVMMHANFRYKPVRFEAEDILANHESKKVLSAPAYAELRVRN